MHTGIKHYILYEDNFYTVTGTVALYLELPVYLVSICMNSRIISTLEQNRR